MTQQVRPGLKCLGAVGDLAPGSGPAGVVGKWAQASVWENGGGGLGHSPGTGAVAAGGGGGRSAPGAQAGPGWRGREAPRLPTWHRLRSVPCQRDESRVLGSTCHGESTWAWAREVVEKI